MVLSFRNQSQKYTHVQWSLYVMYYLMSLEQWPAAKGCDIISMTRYLVHMFASRVKQFLHPILIWGKLVI